MQFTIIKIYTHHCKEILLMGHFPQSPFITKKKKKPLKIYVEILYLMYN